VTGGPRAPPRLAFSKEQVLFDEIVQRGQLIFAQVVFCAGDSMLANFGAAPAGEAHVWFAAVSAGMNDLCCRVAVFDGLEELDADVLGGGVINAGGVDIGDSLVAAPFGGADVLNPAEQLVRIVKGMIGILQAFIVKDKAFDNEFAEFLRGPDAKAGGNGAFDALADGDNGVAVVMRLSAGHALH